MSSVTDTTRTWFSNGIAVGPDGIATTDADGEVLANSGGAITRGVASVTGSLAVTTGLTTITAAVVTLNADAALTGHVATCTFTGGTLTIKVWKPTSSSDTTPIAATAAKSVSWIAIGE